MLDATETAAPLLMDYAAMYIEPGSPMTMLWLELVFASVVTLLWVFLEHIFLVLVRLAGQI